MLRALSFSVTLSPWLAPSVSADVTESPCKSQGSLVFENSPPASRSDLNFCQQYRSSTCCTRAHTTTLLRSAYPLFSDPFDQPFSEQCKEISVSIFCAPCDPGVGTGVLTGLCEEFCDSWFNACKNDFFMIKASILEPCESNALYCSPLQTMVSSGRELCQRSGYEVVTRKSGISSDQATTDLVSLIMATTDLVSLIMNGPPSCFHGQATSVSKSMGAGTSSTATRSSTSTSSKAKTSARKQKSWWERLVKRLSAQLKKQKNTLLFLLLVVCVALLLAQSGKKTPPTPAEVRELREDKFTRTKK
eukprot:g43774.t1